jgi:pyruvate/2-oxoglutarate dehydrogenase complex dihydrolipoamide dehydrogenase (E3) component
MTQTSSQTVFLSTKSTVWDARIQKGEPEMDRYDVLVIGGGQAGIPLAFALAGAGKTVALAERKLLGGSCVNFGCTPTKAAIASAKLAHQVRRAGEYGLRIANLGVDFAAVIERARRMATQSREGHDHHFESTENPKLLRGHARFEGREQANGRNDARAFIVRVGEQTILAEKVVVNTGTRSLIPPIPGLMDVDVIHAGNWLESKQLPHHLAVIGGGYIGLEMAQFYARMGSRVTVLHAGQRIADREDKDVSDELARLLVREGLEIRTDVHIRHVRNGPGGINISFEQAKNTMGLVTSHVFVATGRVINSDDLGLETVGVHVSNRGAIEVNARLETNVPGIYAAGDVTGGPQFTHISWDDYRVLASQIVGDGSWTTKRVVPYGLFTDPELGRVGVTEREAHEQGLDVQVVKFEMKRNGKAREIGERDGFIKLVIDANTDRILGAAVLSNEGAELVHTYVTAMNLDAPYTAIRDAVFVHPTLAEGIQSATALVPNKQPLSPRFEAPASSQRREMT